MYTLSCMLAWRYFKNSSAEKNIATVVKIIFLSLTLGIFGLALIAGIMRGIELSTHKKLQGIHPQIIMRSFGNYVDGDAITRIVSNEFPQIIAISPSSIEQIVVNQQESNTPTVIFLKAIDPKLETHVTSLKNSIIKGPISLEQTVGGNTVLIGDQMAQALNISLHDSLDILCLNSQAAEELSFKKHAVVVEGIIKTGIDDVDASIMICHQNFFKKIFPHAGMSELHAAVAPGTNEQELVKALQDRLGLEVYSWKDLYPSLMAALKLEKYALLFILALIVLIACSNIISLIFMQILVKRTDIAIYYALGMQQRHVQAIFLFMVLWISIAASIAGLTLAYLVGTCIQRYPCIELPDVYYITTLPFQHDWTTYFLIFIFSILLSFLTALLATRQLSALRGCTILRNNG